MGAAYFSPDAVDEAARSPPWLSFHFSMTQQTRDRLSPNRRWENLIKVLIGKWWDLIGAHFFPVKSCDDNDRLLANDNPWSTNMLVCSPGPFIGRVTAITTFRGRKGRKNYIFHARSRWRSPKFFRILSLGPNRPLILSPTRARCPS